MIDTQALLREAAAAIDTTWHSSWHWERDGHSLTLKGWQRAAGDARGRIAAVCEELRALRVVLPKLEERIALMEEWERQDAEDNPAA